MAFDYLTISQQSFARMWIVHLLPHGKSWAPTQRIGGIKKQQQSENIKVKKKDWNVYLFITFIDTQSSSIRIYLFYTTDSRAAETNFEFAKCYRIGDKSFEESYAVGELHQSTYPPWYNINFIQINKADWGLNSHLK